MVKVKQALRNRLLGAACGWDGRSVAVTSFVVAAFFVFIVVWHPHYAFQEFVQLHLSNEPKAN